MGTAIEIARRAHTPQTGGPSTLDIQAATFAGNASLGVISPDGKFVAYVRTDGTDRSIWVRQIATQSDVRIVAPEPGRNFVGLTVTSDGNYVDFVAWDAGATAPALWRIAFLGGAVRKILGDVWTPLGWSPDGRHMAFVRVTADGSTSSLIVANADGSNERLLAARRLPLLFCSAYLLSHPVNRPSWSPDGKHLALAGGSTAPARVDSPAEIVIVDATTGKERQTVAVQKADVLDVSWRNPMQLIVTRGSDSQRLQIWRLDLVSGAFSQATHDLAGFRDVTTTSDGGLIASTGENRRAGLWIGGPGGEEMSPAFADTATLPADVSLGGDDGLLVFSQLFGDGDRDIWRLGPRDTTPTQVAKGGGQPVLSRDGRTVFFAGLDGLYRVGIDGSQVTSLTKGNDFMPDVTADNQTVLFVSIRSGLQSLWTVPAAGGTPTERLHQFAWSPRVSPDGLRLFVGRDPKSGSTICELPKCGQGINVALESPSPTTVHWTPDGKGIAYVRADEPTNIWVRPIGSGKLTQLTHFTDREITSFAWSLNGQRLAISRATVQSDVVLIKDLR
jgi:Tol biopolymer transport system component